MPFSTCCNAHTNYPDINLCPDCLQYCDWVEEEKQNEETTTTPKNPNND